LVILELSTVGLFERVANSSLFIAKVSYIGDLKLNHLTVRVTGGWGETGLETENCQSPEESSKNVHRPSRPVQAARCTLCWAAVI
jgi:hypothetical protein